MSSSAYNWHHEPLPLCCNVLQCLQLTSWAPTPELLCPLVSGLSLVERGGLEGRVWGGRGRKLSHPNIPTLPTNILKITWNICTFQRRVRHYHAYQSVWVAVGEKLPCQIKGRELTRGSVRSCGDDRRVDHRSRKISALCSMHLRQIGQFSVNYWICGSKKLCSTRQQEIFGGRNFRGNKFSRAGVW